MRHIPEDELHAYLDQGLSRTQCVEIESHLADCPSCQSLRDGIAALRDRTTALLARLAPPPSVPPAFEVLRARAAEAASLRRRRLHLLAWAASVVLAVGLGWSARSFVRSLDRDPATPQVVSAPAASARIAASRPSRDSSAPPPPKASPAATRAARPVPRRVPRERTASFATDSTRAARRAAALSVLNPTPAVELTQLDTSGRGEIELDGMWRTMSWDGAKAAAGERLPHIDGLQVMRVQVQSNEEGGRPVMVVAQRLASGQVIRTIEGPATDVTQLLSRGAMREVDSLFPPNGLKRGTDPAGQAMAMQVGDRMLAITGDLPSDSLRAMIRRLNAEMRSK